jgi:hypothetical protein
MRTADICVADARATNHAMSLNFALAVAACPIALFVSDLAAAEHYIEMLLDHSTRHALAHWRAWGLSHQGVLGIQRGDFAGGLRLLRAGLSEPAATGSVRQFFTFLVAEASGRAGQLADGRAAIDEAIGRSERGQQRWLIAELLRIKGVLFLLQAASGAAAAAEGHFQQGARLGAPARGAVLGVARRHQPRPPLARPGPSNGSDGAPPAGLRPVYRRV